MSNYDSELWDPGSQQVAKVSTRSRLFALRLGALLAGGMGLGALGAMLFGATPKSGAFPMSRQARAADSPVQPRAGSSALFAAAAVNPSIPSQVAAVPREINLALSAKDPCQQVDKAEEWRWSKASLEPGAKGYAYRSDLKVRHQERWSTCANLFVPRIESLSDWSEAWRRNHPRWRKSPLRKFQNKWAMKVSPSVPLWDLPTTAKSIGLPHDGHIEYGVHPPTLKPKAYPYYIDRDLERTGFSSHALRAMVVAMQGAMGELQKQGKKYQGMQFVILDASMITGGRMPRVTDPRKAHGSHQSGRDVDIAIALRNVDNGRFYWGHRESSKRLLNRDTVLNDFAKRMGLPSVKALAKKIRAQDRKKRKKRRRKSRRKKSSLSTTQRARIQLDSKLHRYVYDAMWQLVMHAWFPGNLRWAFLDKPQQKLLHAAARRAGDRELADAAIAYGGKRRRKYRKHTAVRSIYQPGGKGHDHHIHLRFNCGPQESQCRD